MSDDPSITIKFDEDDAGAGRPVDKQASWPPPSYQGPPVYGPPPPPVPPPKPPFQGQNIWGGVGAYPYGPQPVQGPSPFNAAGGHMGGEYGPHPAYGPQRPLFPGANAAGGYGSVPYGPQAPAGHVPPPTWKILSQTPNAQGGVGATPYGPERAAVSPQGAYGPVPLPSKDKLGSVIARMAMHEQEAPETSWASSGSKDTLRQAVEMSKSMPAVETVDNRDIEDDAPSEAESAGTKGGKSRRGGHSGVAAPQNILQRIGGTMRDKYWMMPRGYEMQTLRLGAWMSNIGSGIAGGTSGAAAGGAALGVGAAVAGVAAVGAAAVMTHKALTGMVKEGIVPTALAFRHLANLTIAGMAANYVFSRGVELSDRFEREAKSYEPYSGNLGAAFGQREFIEQAGMIRRARELGPQLAEQVTARTYLSEAASNLEGAGVKLLLDQFGPMLERAMLTLEGLMVHAEHGVVFINAVVDVLVKELSPVFPLIHEFLAGFIPFFGPISKFLGDSADLALRERQKAAGAINLDLQKLFGDWENGQDGPPIEAKANMELENPVVAAGQAFANTAVAGVRGFGAALFDPFTIPKVIANAVFE